MKLIKFGIVAVAVCWMYLFLVRCNDPILVGGDLLDSEKLNLGFVDSLKLSSRTIAGDSILTHIASIDSRTYFLGQLDDHLFGKIAAELYLFNNISPGNLPTFTSSALPVTFDSLVLVLQLDTLGSYGLENETHRIELFQLRQRYSSFDTFYSTTMLDYFPGSLADRTIMVRPKDSISLIDHVTGNTIKLPAHIRLRLDDDFGRGLIQDANAATSDTAFVNYIKGFYIKSTPMSGNSLYGLNLGNSALLASTPVNKLIMYYTEGDTTRKAYQYLVNFATINSFVHNRNGSVLQDIIQNPSKGDSLSFMQGIAGAKTVVKFEDLSFLEDKNINHAELEIFLAEIPGPPGNYSPVNQLIATSKLSTGRFEFISDILPLVSLINPIDFRPSFGGGLQTNNGIKKYTINITNHLKKATKNPGFDADIYIGPVTESESPRRSIIYGAKHSQFPMKLKVSYTLK